MVQKVSAIEGVDCILQIALREDKKMTCKKRRKIEHHISASSSFSETFKKY